MGKPTPKDLWDSVDRGEVKLNELTLEGRKILLTYGVQAKHLKYDELTNEGKKYVSETIGKMPGPKLVQGKPQSSIKDKLLQFGKGLAAGAGLLPLVNTIFDKSLQKSPTYKDPYYRKQYEADKKRTEEKLKPKTTGEKVASIAGELVGASAPIGAAYGTGGKVAVKLLPKTAPKLAVQAVRGAGAGAVYGAGKALVEGKDAKEIGKEALINAGAGAILDPALSLAGSAVKKSLIDPLLAKRRIPVNPEIMPEVKAKTIFYADQYGNVRNPNAPLLLPGPKETPTTTKPSIITVDPFGNAVTPDRPPIAGLLPGKVALTQKEKQMLDALTEKGRNLDDVINALQDTYNKALNEQLEYLISSGKKGVTQGGLVRDEYGEVVDRIGRVSNNPKWYRDYYAQYGAAPTQKALRELAIKQLREGFEDDIGGFIPPNKEFKQVDDILKGLLKIKEKIIPAKSKVVIEEAPLNPLKEVLGGRPVKLDAKKGQGLPLNLAPPRITPEPPTPDYSVGVGQRDIIGGRPVMFKGQELPKLNQKSAASELPKIKAPKPENIVHDVDVTKLKDIGGFTARTQDVYRNFKQVFGKNFDKVKKAILDPFDASKKANIQMQQAWLTRLKTEVVDKLGIKKGSKESALVQQYGEGRITLDELKKIAPDKWQNIVEADKWFRKAYDELLDTVNTVRAQIYPNNPDKIIPKRKDYYRHFQEMTGLGGLKNLFETPAAIDPELVGISEFTQPKSKFLSFAQKRKGGAFKDDAVGGFLNYIPSASYATHIDPHISKFAKLAGDLAKATKETKNLNNFIEFLRDYAQDLAGKTPYLDRVVIKYIPGGRKALRALNWLNSRVKANVVLGNASSALSQLANIPQGIAYAKEYAIPGAGRTLKAIFAKDSPMSQSGFLMERYGGHGSKLYRQFDTKLLDQPMKFATWMLETADRIGTSFIWNSAYSKALAEGAKDAVKQADEVTRSLVAGRGIGEVPLLQKSKIFQLIAPFQLEVANLWHVQKDFIKEKDFGALVTLYLASFLFNKAMEETRGSGVMFDPIKAMVDAFGEEDLTPLQRGGRLAGEVLSNLPLGQRVAAEYPEYGMTVGKVKLPTRKELFGRQDPTRFGSGLLLTKALQDPLTKILPPFGGAQIEKTIKGIQALKKGGVYNAAGTQLKYPVKVTTENKIKGTLFGPGSLDETKEYYEKNRRPLSEKQTKAIEGLPKAKQKEAYEKLQLKRRLDQIKRDMAEVRKDGKLTKVEKLQQLKKLREKFEKLQKGG